MRAFTPAEIRKIRQGGKTADLVTVREAPRSGTVQILRREITDYDEAGNEIGTIRVTVKTADGNGELVPEHLTILVTEEVEIYVPGDGGLTQEMARACGYRTAIGLREAWAGRHPRTDRGAVVWFALGDVRDQPLFLNFTGVAGGDYTRNRARALDEAEALTREQMAELTSRNRQKDQGRRAQAADQMASVPLSERVRLLESAPPDIQKLYRQELRIVGQRVARAETMHRSPK